MKSISKIIGLLVMGFLFGCKSAPNMVGEKIEIEDTYFVAKPFASWKIERNASKKWGHSLQMLDEGKHFRIDVLVQEKISKPEFDAFISQYIRENEAELIFENSTGENFFKSDSMDGIQLVGWDMGLGKHVKNIGHRYCPEKTAGLIVQVEFIKGYTSNEFKRAQEVGGSVSLRCPKE